MDERKPSIPLGKFHFRSASGSTSAVVCPPPAELRCSLARQTRCGQIEPSASDFAGRPSVVTYCRNAQEVGRGFLIALSAMGLAPDEQSSEPPKLPGSAHAQELNPVLNAVALAAETSGSQKES